MSVAKKQKMEEETKGSSKPELFYCPAKCQYEYDAVLYHFPCLDGTLAYHAFRKCVKSDSTLECKGHAFRGVISGAEPDLNLAWTKDKTVLVLDMDLSPDYIARAQFKSVFVMDHHVVDPTWESPVKMYHPDPKDHSCCVSAYQFFHPERSIPSLYQYVDEGDRFDFTLPYSQAVFTLLRMDKDWDLARAPFEYADKLVNEFESKPLVERVKAVLAQTDHEEHAYQAAFKSKTMVKCTLTGHEIPLFPCDNFAHISLFGARMAKGMPFSASYRYDMTNRVFRVSLRSSSQSDVDCSAIARQLKGNGHRQAAGFIVSPTSFAMLFQSLGPTEKLQYLEDKEIHALLVPKLDSKAKDMLKFVAENPALALLVGFMTFGR